MKRAGLSLVAAAAVLAMSPGVAVATTHTAVGGSVSVDSAQDGRGDRSALRLGRGDGGASTNGFFEQFCERFPRLC